MNRIFLDAKRLLLGEDGSENTPLDFKDELALSIKEKIIDKAKASLLMLSRKNADSLADNINKKQINDVPGKGSKVVKDKVKKEIDEVEDMKDKKLKDKKEKEKKDRQRKEQSLRQTLQQIAEKDEIEQNNLTKNKQKDK